VEGTIPTLRFMHGDGTVVEVTHGDGYTAVLAFVPRHLEGATWAEMRENLDA
jgi:hypothetical protein